MIWKYLRQKILQRRFSAILSGIERADDKQISRIIQAIVHRYALVYPDWDVMFLSLPKEPAARREQLRMMLNQLNEHDTLL